MGKINDLTGQRFGKLVAVSDTGQRTKSRSVIWLCRCDCGNEVKLPSSALVSGNTKSCGCLRNGNVRGGIGGCKPVDWSGHRFGMLTAIERVGSNNDRDSLWMMRCDCGNTCIKDISIAVRGELTSCGCKSKPYDHRYERLHVVYHGIKARCYQKSHISYKWYGARGIRMCDEWLHDFDAFKDWALASGYQIDAPRGACTIDRIDPNGNYEPSNCRWLSIAEQQRNKCGEVVDDGRQPETGQRLAS